MERRLNTIETAFDILMEEFSVGIHALNEAGAQAFAAGDYQNVDAFRKQAQRLTEVRNEVAALRKRWSVGISIPSVASKSDVRNPKTKIRKSKRLPRGVRTPEGAFRLPILQALVTLGGSAPVRDVLDIVEHLMKSQLNEIDYQALPSNPRLPRWRNAAQWTRQSMVNEGLLRSDSPRGIWEITEAGRHLVRSSGMFAQQS